MIDMLDMTDQQLNRKLAQLMGYSLKILDADEIYYRVIAPNGFAGPYRYTSDDAFLYTVPDYSSDPAASLEVQAKAIEVDAEGYVNKLTTIVDACIFWSSDCCMDPIGVTWLMTATPRERAEAAYMTLSSRV